MRYIYNTCTDIYFNLAAEEYLFRNPGKEILMIWQSDPAVVIGKNQDVYAEVNIGYTQKNEIKIARRQSGGGAVYHDAGNVNVSFIETVSDIHWDTYTNRLLNALEGLGLQATTNDRRSIFLSGRKISGTAQYVYKNRVLFHATLLFDSDLKKVNESLEADTEILPGSVRNAMVRSVKSPVANIKTHLPEAMNTEEFKRYLLHALIRKGADSQSYQWSKEDLIAIHAIRKNKLTL